MYNVLKFQAPFERLKSNNLSPEVMLYKAIITQAIIDATNISSSRNAKLLELEAKDWLFGKSAYFDEVCYKAEIEPLFVIRIAREAIKINNSKKPVKKATKSRTDINKKSHPNKLNNNSKVIKML